MRVFFDFEFIESGISFVMEPISLGMVREDGKDLYIEFADVDWSIANEWVLSNVKPYLTEQDLYSRDKAASTIKEFVGDSPEFWAYFADYDWVLLCQLFGSMMDLPKGWPMYCLDLKQYMWHFDVKKEQIYVPNEAEHHALADAWWNKRAFDYLTNEVRGGNLHIVRPWKDNRGRHVGRSGEDDITS